MSQATFTQTNRKLAVTTPFGKDVLLLSSFSGTEEISVPFRFDLEMWSTNQALDPVKIVGKNVTVTARYSGGDPREFNGIVSRFSAGITRDTLRQYRAEVVPWLWFLGNTLDCRIYQNESIPDIVEATFERNGFSDYKTSGLTAKYSPLEYCVQYDESDLNFVSRLMEQAGIFYWFQHAQGKHTLILADGNGTFADNPDATVQYSYGSSRQARVNRIFQWEHRYEYHCGKRTQTDYNFIDHPAKTTKIPSTSLLADVKTIDKFDKIQSFEKYDYPGLYRQKADGTTAVQILMQADEIPGHQVFGSGMCQSFVPGTKFTIDKHECTAENGKKYVLTSVTHAAHEPASYRMTAGDEEVAFDYRNDFVCIPEATRFRPVRMTPKPRIMGSQTAVVVGPSGEEIWPDPYGRVKVQFFWDRIGQRDDKSSCWVRCAQTSAGKGWGSIFIPRIGQEVVVSYLDGDPDRPLITGVVYNADQMPPYKLPDNKTRSTLKTNSSKGGKGFNEIRIEDLASKEQIFVHAQRNADIRVLNDAMEHVINDRHLIVGQNQNNQNTGNQLELVFGNKDLHVKGNHVEQIEGNVQWMAGNGDDQNGGNVDLVIARKKSELISGDNDYHLKGNLQEKVDGTASLQIVGDRMEKLSGNDSSNIANNLSVEIGGQYGISITGNHSEKCGGDVSLNATGALQQQVGTNAALGAGQTVYIKGGTSVVIEAGTQLTLKVGGNFVVIDASGVAITGSMVKLNSGGSAGSGSGPTPNAPSAPAAPNNPADAVQAKPIVPTEADDAITGTKSAPDSLS